MAIPLTPNNLSPAHGQELPVSQSNVFTWTADGTQAGYYIEYAQNMAVIPPSNTGWQSISTSSHTFAADTFVNIYSYKWRVKVRNTVGQESAYSEWAIFTGGNELVLDIVFPDADYDVVLSLPLYQHLFSSPYGYVQEKFQYKVYSGAIWDDIDALTAAEQESMTWDELELYGGSLIWDSGEITSAATSIQQPGGYFVAGTYWYKVRVIITDNMGTVYESDLRTFYILIDSIPKTPIITATDDPDNGQNIVTITNPTPDAGQVATDYNRLYRKNIDSTWELIQDNISGLASLIYSMVMFPSAFLGTLEIGYDTTCRSSKQEEYAVSAVGTNGIEGSMSTSAYATCVLDAYWFTNLTTLETVKLRLGAKWGQMQSERGREEYTGIDEIYPSVSYDPKRFYRGPFQGAVEMPIDGTRWPDYIAQIRAILDAGDEVLYRSLFGDIFKFDIYDFEFDPEDRFDQYRIIRFNMVETTEAVAPGSYTYDTPPNPMTGFWLVDPDTNTGMELVLGPKWDGMKSEQERSENIGLTAEMPSVSRSNKKAYRGGFSGYLKATSTESCGERVAKFRELVDGKTKKPLLFRTIRGDLHYVDTYGFSFELYDRFDNARQVNFEMIEIGVI